MTTIEEIEHISNLSKLRFDKEEQLEVLNYINDAIKQVSVLNDIDTGNVTLNVTSINIDDLRDDSVGKSFTQEQALANAPQKRDGGFVVPQVIE